LLKKYIQKNYLLYGGSIIVARGFEYVILFTAAGLLNKENYGELEYFKKLIEVVSSIFAFGFPALIISYTKSSSSKTYFYFLACLITLIIGGISMLFFDLYDLSFLILALLFYALFFNGGITPAYLLVKKGGAKAAYYKIIVSLAFYSILFIGLNYLDIKSDLYPYGGTWLFPVFVIYMLYVFWYDKIVFSKAKKYWALFKKLLASSFTLVISNFANLMFLYTDIFIIKLIAENPDPKIADFSFALNIATMLLLIPITLVQVDIEKLKQLKDHLQILNKRITILVLITSLILLLAYPLLINKLFPLYESTITLFYVLLVAKIFHSLSTLYGTNLLILKKFKLNLYLNISMLILNILLCFVGYYYFNIIGVAASSALTLALRFIILKKYNNKYH